MYCILTCFWYVSIQARSFNWYHVSNILSISLFKWTKVVTVPFGVIVCAKLNMDRRKGKRELSKIRKKIIDKLDKGTSLRDHLQAA